MEELETTEGWRREVAALRARRGELREAVASAERHVQRLERILAVVPGAVWESEGSPGQPTYRMPYVGGEVERIFGYTLEECIQRADFWTSIVHPDDTAGVLRDLAEIAETGGRLSEHRFVTKEGHSVWVETHITLHRDESGAIVGRSVVAPDVTERVLAERARRELLARSQELAQQLDNLIASVPGLVWETRGRAEGAVLAPIFLSDYLTTLIGYRPEDILTTPLVWNQIAHPEDQALIQEEIDRIHGSESGRLQCRWITKDGRTIWVEMHVRVLSNEAGEIFGACGVTLDITARKLVEQERARLKEQVIQAQEATLVERSAPLIPISENVMVMPLIGSLNPERAGHVMAALLDGLSKVRAKVAILDITGAHRVDAQTAAALLRAARAVQLLGVEVVLTGLRPESAAILVSQGVSFQGITVCGTLESGITQAKSLR